MDLVDLNFQVDFLMQIVCHVEILMDLVDLNPLIQVEYL